MAVILPSYLDSAVRQAARKLFTAIVGNTAVEKVKCGEWAV